MIKSQLVCSSEPKNAGEEDPPDIEELLVLIDNADEELSDIASDHGEADGVPSDSNPDGGAQGTGVSPVVSGAPGQLSDSD